MAIRLFRDDSHLIVHETPMTIKTTLLICCLTFGTTVSSQNYTSYSTGSSTDLQTNGSGGICLMGGASEDDNAMKWFLSRANGGDILVLRASGSDGYNNYLYSQLNVSVNSVETIVFNDSTAADESYIHQKIQQAEGIWFAGGDQWDYLSYWRGSAIDSLINHAITTKNIVVGGTSAGMAIQGGFYFSAENNTVSSAAALANPYNSNVTVDSTSFIAQPILQEVVTDTHYDNPNRKGRHVTFLARIFTDYGIAAKGIACDEYTAVCIDTSGIASVYGDHPTYDDNAYFIQTNCELANAGPEDCTSGNVLDWNRGNEALKVYVVKGTTGGVNSFDLNDWKSGTGGSWEHWYVDNGVLNEVAGTAPNCSGLALRETEGSSFKVYPNPASEAIHLDISGLNEAPETVHVRNALGQTVKTIFVEEEDEININVDALPAGVYMLRLVRNGSNAESLRFIIARASSF